MNSNILQNRELDETKSLEIIESEMKCLEQKKTKLLKKKDNRQTFLNNVTEWGYGSTTEFLIEMGYIPNPLVKKPKTKITEELTRNVINDVKSVPKMTTEEIGRKNGVPVSTIDAIKKKHGLTNRRTKKVSTPVVPVQSTPPVSESEKSSSPLAA